MRNFAFFLLGALALSLFSLSSPAYACGAKTETTNVGFNIGNKVFTLAVPKKLEQDYATTLSIEQSEIADIYSKWSITIGKGLKTIKVTTKGKTFTGELGGLYRCLDTPLAVYKWDDQSQNESLEKVNDEMTWITTEGEYKLFRNGNQKFYISKAALGLFQTWGYTITADFFIKGRTGTFDLIGKNDENEIIFINTVDNDKEVAISGKTKTGNKIFYLAYPNGKIENQL